MPDFTGMVDMGTWEGEGYEVVVDSPNESWMVAIKNFAPGASLADFASLHRHPESDETFVLLAGRSALVVGEGEDKVTAVHEITMRPLTAYNVRRNVWHGNLMTKDAVLLIAENRTVTSAFCDLTPEQRGRLRGP